MKLPTRLLSAAAAALLLSLTAACDAGTSDGGDGRASAAQEQATGGGGTDTTDSQSSSGGGSDTSSGGADKGEICDKARQALTRFSDRAASAVGDHSVFNKAAEDLSAELKELSDQADGELKTHARRDGPLVGLPQDRHLRPHRLGERDDRGHQADQRADPEPHHRLRLVSRRVLGKGPPAGTRPAGLLRGPEGAQPLSAPSFAPRTK